jgi:prepilin-type N-terminal cleavage/methylation domain-containing protein
MNRRRQTGFTLIEMIVATLLLAIGVTGAMVALGTATRASGFAQEMETAALLAQRQFTQIQLQAQSSQSLSNGTQQGDFSPDHPDYHWTEDVEPGNYTNLYQVTLTISWGSATTPHTRVFTTYMNVGQPQNSSGTSTTTTGTGGQTGAQNGG